MDNEFKILREKYRQTLLAYRSELQLALSHADVECIRKIAHKVAGTALSFEFDAISELAKKLENYCTEFEKNFPKAATDAVGALSFLSEARVLIGQFSALVQMESTER